MTLAAARARRWWDGRAQITTATKAAAFVDDVGFALLFPRQNLPYPCLWERARDDPPDGSGWGPDIQRVWAWKDDLPKRGRAWYGDFLAGAKCFLSPSLLALLYPHAGGADDFAAAGLSPPARAIAQLLLDSGPTSSAVAREAVGLGGKAGKAAYSRALVELGRALVITHFGVEEEKAGWPSAMLELTARVFSVPAAGPLAERRVAAAARFVDTMVATDARTLGRAFGWPAAEARAALDALVERGAARAADGLYAPSTPGRRRPISRG